MKTPNELLEELEVSRSELARLGAEFQLARRAHVRLQVQFEKEEAKVYIDLLHPTSRAQMGLEKMPAEDMRKVIARDRMPSKTYEDYLASEADLESFDKLIKIELANMNGLQSELKHLTEELAHT